MKVQHKYLEMFLEEGAEILSKLYEKVLRLEENPSDREAIDGALRLAHTLKGGAKMVGLGGVSTVAHALEQSLKEFATPDRQGGRDATPLLRVLDEIQSALVALDSPAGGAKETGGAVGATPETVLPQLGTAGAAPAARATDRIRVSIGRLDDLQNHVDDLAIFKGKLKGRADRVRRALRGLDRLVSSLDGALSDRERELLQSILPGLSGENLRGLEDDVHELHHRVEALQRQVLDLRMVPLSDVLDEFGRTVRDLARDLSKEVSFSVQGQFTEIDRGLLEAVQGPLRHLVRNAVDHGIEGPDEREALGKPRNGALSIRAYHKASAVVIEVEDDGRGLDPEVIRQKAASVGLLSEADARALSDDEALYLLCTPGFTTTEQVTEISGRGIGLDAVRMQMEYLKGALAIQGQKGVFARFRLFVPLSISSLPMLIVRAGTAVCGIPSSFVDRCVKVRRPDLVGDGTSVVYGDRVLPLVSLARILGEPERRKSGPRGALAVVVLHYRGRLMALQVDEMLDEREVVLKSLGEHLGGVPYVLGVSFLADEQPVPVINVVDLHPQWTRLETSCRYSASAGRRVPRVLVVDDSMTTRHMERAILEGLGYEVLQASDGLEAWRYLRDEPVDAMLTDVEMPGMDGLDLTRRVRSHATLGKLPVIVISNRGTEADVHAGLSAGADVYLQKDRFSQRELGATLRRLLRGAASSSGGLERVT